MRKILTILLVGSAFFVSAQHIEGPTSVKVNERHTYTFSNGTLYMGIMWVANLGTVDSTWQTSTTYYARVVWETAGSTGYVRALNTADYSQVGSLTNVTVLSATAPPMPNATFTIVNECGSTSITRNTNPPLNADYYWYWQTSASGTSIDLGYGATIDRTVTGTLYLRAKLKYVNIWSISSQSVPAFTVVSTPPPAPASATHGDVITGSATAVSVSVSTVSGATSYAWYTQSSNGTPVGGVSSNSFSPVLSTSQNYYVSSLIGTCESTSRIEVQARIHPVPVIEANNNSNITMGRPVTLSVNNYLYNSYQWLDNSGNPIIGETQSTLQELSQAGNYYVRVTKNNSSSFTSSAVTVTKGLTGQNMNYVAVNTIQSDNVTLLSQVVDLGPEAVQQQVQYFDGLGRPIQAVTVQGSPGKLDIVTPVVYDALGREYRKYLPFVVSDNGYYKTVTYDGTGNYSGVAGSTYWNNSSGKIAQDLRPFSETSFELSPLGRPLVDIGTGKSWSDNNRNVSIQYQSNLDGTTTGSEKIIIWRISASGLPEKDLSVNGGFYPSGTLYINSTKDEQGNEVREYKNKSSQVILKKVFAAGNPLHLNDDNNWAQTYYIYDDFGNLVMVLPPEAVKALTE